MRKLVKELSNGSYLVVIRTKRNIFFQLGDIPTRREADLCAARELARIVKQRKEAKARKRARAKANRRRVPCSGNCRSIQTVRPASANRLQHWSAVGCGKCPGWAALSAQPVPQGYIRIHQNNVIGSFRGFRHQLATVEDRAAVARASALARVAVEIERDPTPWSAPKPGLLDRVLHILEPLDFDISPPGARSDSKYHTLNGLKTCGWTESVVRRFMPEPDKLVRNPYYSSAGKMRLYARDRVIELEKSPSVQQALRDVRLRRDKRIFRLVALMQHAQQATPTAIVGSPTISEAVAHDLSSAIEAVRDIITEFIIYDAEWEAWVRRGGTVLLAFFCNTIFSAITTEYPELDAACRTLHAHAMEHVELCLHRLSVVRDRNIELPVEDNQLPDSTTGVCE